MPTTFLKRQKEMKRQEKQREKAERRAQKKLASRAAIDGSPDNVDPASNEDSGGDVALPSESERQD
jgi:hypothetical protein